MTFQEILNKYEKIIEAEYQNDVDRSVVVADAIEIALLNILYKLVAQERDNENN